MNFQEDIGQGINLVVEALWPPTAKCFRSLLEFRLLIHLIHVLSLSSITKADYSSIAIFLYFALRYRLSPLISLHYCTSWSSSIRPCKPYRIPVKSAPLSNSFFSFLSAKSCILDFVLSLSWTILVIVSDKMVDGLFKVAFLDKATLE